MRTQNFEMRRTWRQFNDAHVKFLNAAQHGDNFTTCGMESDADMKNARKQIRIIYNFFLKSNELPSTAYDPTETAVLGLT